MGHYECRKCDQRYDKCSCTRPVYRPAGEVRLSPEQIVDKIIDILESEPAEEAVKLIKAKFNYGEWY